MNNAGFIYLSEINFDTQKELMFSNKNYYDISAAKKVFGYLYAVPKKPSTAYDVYFIATAWGQRSFHATTYPEFSFERTCGVIDRDSLDDLGNCNPDSMPNL